MSRRYLFTSESVTEGHPDKICDQISDTILDALLSEDPRSRVAAEVVVNTGLVLITGEVSSKATVNFIDLARQKIAEIGYTNADNGFSANSCSVLVALDEQSADIAQGVNVAQENRGTGNDEAFDAIGAGDQGLMFGYATNETDVLMPAPIYYSHRLVERQAHLRKNGVLTWLRPDAKSQVTLRYENGKPVAVDAVVLSTQHDPDISLGDIREAVMEEMIKPVLPHNWLHAGTQYHINPTGQFIIGGPVGDCGLTGRKIIVDTYGGMARHGGGAFSGKDPSKVDRSAAYAGRYVAKNIVAAGLADLCEIQVSYAIGVADPTSISINTLGTGKLEDDKIAALVREHCDRRPQGLIDMLNLRRPIYGPTAAYGHFGRELPDFTWEQTDKAEQLSAAAS